MTKAVQRFREFVRQHRAALPRKERRDSAIYEDASIRQVLEQVGFEVTAGIPHDPSEVVSIIELANERAAAATAEKRPKPRFRGLGR